MIPPPDAQASWSASLHRTSDSLLGLAQSRVELFAVELQEEKLRTLGMTLGVALGLALGAAGFAVGLAALALFLWHTAGYLGLTALAIVLLGAAAIVMWRIHVYIQRSPSPFAETISEFRKDRECLLANH